MSLHQVALALTVATAVTSAFTVEIVQEGSGTTVVKQNDRIQTVTHMVADPPMPDPEEGLFMATDFAEWDVHGEESDELGLLPEGMWKGMLGAKLGEKRVITIPEHESFKDFEEGEEDLPEGHRGLKVTVEILKINDEQVADFDERLPPEEPEEEYDDEAFEDSE